MDTLDLLEFMEIVDITFQSKKKLPIGCQCSMYIIYCYTNKENGEKISYIDENNIKVEKAKDVGVKYTGICRTIKNDCRSGGFYWRKAG